jgi:lipopolysaccharide export system protein LptC
MKRLEIWFPVALMLSLAALTYWLDHSVQSAPPKRDGSMRHDPDYVVGNFKTTRMGTDGTPHFVLTATKMTHYPDDDSTYLEQPHFIRYHIGGPLIHITGNHGMVSTDGEHVYFTGNVRVKREAFGKNGPLTLDTEFLHIIPDQDIANSDKAVTLRDANTIVTAVGLELNNKTRVMKLLSRVKGHHEKPKR